MALSGSVTTGSYDGRYYKVSWTATQSVSTNKSTVSWTLEALGGADSWYAERTLTVVLGGSTVYSKSTRVERYKGVIATGTKEISHNSSGGASFSISIQAAVYTSAINCTGSNSFTLNTIPRKSTLSVGNGTLNTAQTLTVTRLSTSFTHTIVAKCGSASTTICTKSTTTSISFTPPLSWASQNTTGTSVSVTYTITTYSGNTNVGSNSYTKTCSIPASVKPTCTLTVTDPTGHSDTYGSFVKGLSKFKIVVTPTTAYGSPINTYKTTANGTAYTKASFTTGLLSSSGTLTVSTTVTDKRGRSGAATVSKSVINYNAPVINKLTVHRCNEDGSVLNDQGEYVKVTFSATVSSLNSKNTATYILKYKKHSTDTFTEVGLDEYADNYSVVDGYYVFPADTSSSYNIEFSISDQHNTTYKTTTASTGFTMLHFNIGGDGMGIGKVSELPGVLDIGMLTRHYGGLLHPVLEPETDLNDIRTPNTYVGANISQYNYANCPLTSGTFSLEVIGQGEDGQVKQRLTYCHKSISRIFERFYYSSAWGEWVCVSDYAGTLLASPAMYMTAGHTVNLSEPISKQKNGIALVFSHYSDGSVSNAEWVIHNVPKYMIINHPSGGGYAFECNTSFRNAIKYLYITDTTITGHANNGETITVGGTTYVNNSMVLRYVIGV